MNGTFMIITKTSSQFALTRVFSISGRCAKTHIFISSCLLAALAGSAGADPALPLPFHEPFAGPALHAAWQVDAANGNTVRIAEGALEIRARENTYAHVQRPLGEDFIRLRLRHPQGLSIRSVDAPAGVSATAKGDQITLPSLKKPVELRVTL